MPSYVENPPEVKAISSILNTYLRWRNVNGPQRSYKVHHPSSFGGCLRKVQYQRYAELGHVKIEPESLEAKTIRIFDNGHSMHDRWAKYWEDLGVLRGIWECLHLDCKKKHGEEEKLGVFKPEKCSCGNNQFRYHEISAVDEELNFHGHVDQILDFSNFSGGKQFKEGKAVRVLFKDADIPKEPVLVDMKSINSFGYKSKLDSGAPFGYKVQVNIYLHILGIDLGILYFENKDDCSTKLIPVKKDAVMWEKIREQASQMDSMEEHLKLPPPRPINKRSSECKYCQFQPICHSAGIWEDHTLDEKRLRFYGEFS